MTRSELWELEISHLNELQINGKTFGYWGKDNNYVRVFVSHTQAGAFWQKLKPSFYDRWLKNDNACFFVGKKLLLKAKELAIREHEKNYHVKLDPPAGIFDAQY